jgi:hypothetical protein
MSRYYRENPDADISHDWTGVAEAAPSRIDEEGRCMALPANEESVRCRACGCDPCASWCGCEEMA